jgi:hypothetical protein
LTGLPEEIRHPTQHFPAWHHLRRVHANPLANGRERRGVLSGERCFWPDTGPALSPRGYRRQLATASVTALIDRLEHLRLVARRRHRSDRRKVVVDLSETGQNAAELVHCQLGAALGDAASLWSRNRVPQLPPTRENRAFT